MLVSSIQTHHVYSTLQRRENDSFHGVTTWNKRGVFVGLIFAGHINLTHYLIVDFQKKCRNYHQDHFFFTIYVICFYRKTFSFQTLSIQ